MSRLCSDLAYRPDENRHHRLQPSSCEIYRGRNMKCLHHTLQIQRVAASVLSVILLAMLHQSNVAGQAEPLPAPEDRPLQKITGFIAPQNVDDWKMQAAFTHALSTKLTAHFMANLAPESSPTTLPSDFTWKDKGILSPVKDQGIVGVCWAFATTEAFESSYMKVNHVTNIEMSVKAVLDCTPTDDIDGGFFDEPCNVMATEGLPAASKLRYDPITARKEECRMHLNKANPDHIDPDYYALTYDFVSNTEMIPTNEELKRALIVHGPLAVAFDATENFHKYKPSTTQPAFVEYDTKVPNHAMLLVGWNDKKDLKNGYFGAWYVRNQWGTQFGEDGYVWIGYGCNSIGYTAIWVDAKPENLLDVSDLFKTRNALKSQLEQIESQ
jgi:hypothetical protein